MNPLFWDVMLSLGTWVPAFQKNILSHLQVLKVYELHGMLNP